MQKPTTKPKDPEREKKIEEFKKKIISDNNDYHILQTAEDYEKIDINKMNTWIVDGSGIYLTVKNRIGEFTAKVSEKGPGGLPTLMKEKFIVYLPLIPNAIFKQIQKFFYDIADEMNNAEAFVQVYYDLEDQKYLVHVPTQKVSGASVVYDCEENLDIKNFDRYILALEIHSHNTMSAFFSGVDDSDEKETRFYGVFGKIKNSTPEFVCRFVIRDRKLLIKPESIFDFKEEDVNYPQEWKSKIHKMNDSTGLSHLDDYNKNKYKFRAPETNYNPNYTGYHGSNDYPGWDDENWYSRYYNRDVSEIPPYVSEYIKEWESQRPPESDESRYLNKLSDDAMRGSAEQMQQMNDAKTSRDFKESDFNRDQIIHDFVCELETSDIPILCDALEAYGLIEKVRSWILHSEGR